MNWQKRFFWMFGAVICLFVMTATMAWAYFDRGPVKVTAAQNSVSVAVGKSTTVSISTSPSSDDQLPGCGMAECPQICGEKNCLDENGECTCNGTEYKTYYTDVTTASSNSSVAKASYNNGVLTITGVSAGEADVTVTAALRQYTSTTQTIHVTVSGGNTASTDKKETTVKTPNKGEIEVVKEQPKEDTAVITVGEAEQPEQSDTAVEDNAEDIPSENTGEEENRYSVDSDRGLIHFVAIQDGLMGKDDLAAVQGKDEKAVSYTHLDVYKRQMYIKIWLLILAAPVQINRSAFMWEQMRQKLQLLWRKPLPGLMISGW